MVEYRKYSNFAQRSRRTGDDYPLHHTRRRFRMAVPTILQRYLKASLIVGPMPAGCREQSLSGFVEMMAIAIAALSRGEDC